MGMIGLGPVEMNGGARSRITLVGTRTSTGASISTPAGAAAGDLALLFDMTSSPAASVVPSGFTQIGSDLNLITIRLIVSSLVLSGSGSHTGMNGSYNSKRMIVFRPPVGFSWASAASISQQASTGYIADQTITAGTAPYVALAYYQGNVDPVRGFTPAQDAEYTMPTIAGFVRYKIFDVGSASILTTSDYEVSGIRLLQSFRVGAI